MGLNPIGNPEWPKQTADLVERVVGSVRSKTTDNIVKLVRIAVYGVIIAFAALIGLILFTILLTRLLQRIISTIPVGEPHQGRAVWISYLFVGVVFVVAGTVLMRKRHSSSTS
jgi:hypothetical protein